MSQNRPYLDLDRAYPRPATDVMGHVGWWHQVSANLDEMYNSINISGGNSIGWVQDAEAGFATPAWVGIDNAATSEAGHIRVGQMCWIWARSSSCELTDEQAGYVLPVPAADSVLPMATVLGYIGNGTDERAVTGRIIDGALRFWFASGLGSFDSALSSASYPTSGGTTGLVFSVAGSYRCVPPPPGRLTDRVRRLDKQERS